jgi:hypothetical protein
MTTEQFRLQALSLPDGMGTWHQKLAGCSCVLAFLMAVTLACGHAVRAHAAAEGTGKNSPVIVVGFVGGYVRHDDPVRGGVQMAARLRAAYPTGVKVEVLENHRGEEAHQEILRLLDANQDGKLTAEEKARARIIIYGISWGGSETVTLASELEKDGIPVALTIQVDSVAKLGEQDAIIPANVAEAVNFYQTDGLLHGRRDIGAADAARTRILGNFHLDYKDSQLKCDGYPLRQRVFFRAHTQIECDPKVWDQVESLIRSKLPGIGRSR